MSKEESKIGHCPNCGESAIRTGHEIACEQCDCTFEWHVSEKKAATVKSVGIEERLKKVEDKVFAEPESPTPEPPTQEPEEQGL